MDSLIAAAARALSSGDALTALKHVALREDPAALALRGIAMAQLGEYGRARALLRRAGRRFGTQEVVARARCVVAEAEIALVLREISASPRALLRAMATLDAHGDRANANHSRVLALRRSLLLGRLEEASRIRAELQLGPEAPPALLATAELAGAELAVRALEIDQATAAPTRARTAALRAGIGALLAEVEEARATLARPAARLEQAGQGERLLRLDEVAALRRSGALVVDACQLALYRGDFRLSLVRRPVLFGLASALARAWPDTSEREPLIATVFRTRDPDDSHRARLRVQIGRLRALLRPLARIEATPTGFQLCPLEASEVMVLSPPIAGPQGALLALLADGAAWSTSALALALGASQRTVQRALADLERDGKVRAIGQARARRWLTRPLAGFTTTLLLPAPLRPA
ncbi:MAG: helix-turn-helix domain-containing protein [Lysobacterales bacterium]